MEESGIKLEKFSEDASRLSRQGQTPMYVALDGTLQGIISVADVIKETSREAIADLQKMGVRVVLLTGDNSAAAGYIGEQVAADEVISEVLPEDKAAIVQRFQDEGHVVMMVGDGINDAPALVQADIGASIGTGSDIAIESGDLVLMKSDLKDIGRAFRLSKYTIRNIKQNLFWAFCYNTIGIPIAAGVLFPVNGMLLDPMFAGLAMSLSSVCVVGNALRLKLFRPKHHYGKIESSKQGADEMKKIVHVNGMSCAHCQAAVEKALMGVAGVEKAEVNLKKKLAEVKLAAEVSDAALMDAVNEAGFEAVSVEEK